ncbi:hypothetical protein HYU21_02905 [Candidatus Woesearchaeota archaeon]|nr:hypothetical protein [Candidatus Woesearchaeota archaeon]
MTLLTSSEKSFLKRIIPFTAFLGGLCCFTPLLLVLLGLSSVSFAASLSNMLYGGYKWIFRGIALVFLLTALGWYLYKKESICTLDQIKREKRKIINLILLSVTVAVLAYIIWLYVIVEIIGAIIGIW